MPTRSHVPSYDVKGETMTIAARRARSLNSGEAGQFHCSCYLLCSGDNFAKGPTQVQFITLRRVEYGRQYLNFALGAGALSTMRLLLYTYGDQHVNFRNGAGTFPFYYVFITSRQATSILIFQSLFYATGGHVHTNFPVTFLRHGGPRSY